MAKSKTPPPPSRLIAKIDAAAKTKGIQDRDLATLLGCPLFVLDHLRSGRCTPPHPGTCSGYRPLAEALDLDHHELGEMAQEERRRGPRHPLKRERQEVQR